MDFSQTLNQTGIDSFTIVEEDPKAIISIGSKGTAPTGKPGALDIEQPPSANKSTGMVDNSMPTGKGQANQNGNLMESNPPQKKCCFCIPIGKSKSSNKDISIDSDGNQSKTLSDSLVMS